MMYTDETLPAGISPAMVRRFERVDRLAKKYTEVRARLAVRIYEAFGPGTHLYGNIIVKRTTANVVDTKRFQTIYPADKYPEYYKYTLDVSSIPAEVKGDFLMAQERASVTAA